MSTDPGMAAKQNLSPPLNRPVRGHVLPDVPDAATASGERGADEAFIRALYAEHGGALHRYAMHLTGGDAQRAEDLVQETMVRAWRHPEALADRPARPWLFAVARNLAVDAHRARQSRPNEVGQSAFDTLPAHDDADRTLESWAVAEALASLRPDHRTVIVETYYRGCSVAEAAATLGIPAGTVKSRTYYALKALKLALQERGAGTVTPTMECPEARVSLGVYVLGAIDPAERALVEAHLATCRDCRDELAGLAALPALLARVSAEEAVALAAGDGPPPAGRAAGGEAPPELAATVIDLAAARRRRRRWRDASLGVAAALIVAAGVFGGLRLGGSPAPPAATSVNYPGQPNGPWQTATTSADGMSASVEFRSMGWGTDLAVKVSGIPVGTSCQLWVIGPGGRRTLAGGWVTDDHEGAVWYPGSAGLATGGVRGFQVIVGGTRTLSLTA